MEHVNFYDFVDEERAKRFVTAVRSWSYKEISDARLQLVKMICGDILPPTKAWPESYVKLFFKKPLKDCEFAKLIWFLIGKCYIIILSCLQAILYIVNYI